MTWQLRVVLALLAASISLSIARADPVPQWNGSIEKAEKKVTVLDCLNCDEEISVLLTCKFGSGTVHVELPALSSEEGKEGDVTSLTLSVSGKAKTYQAKLVYWGMIGNFPAFDVKLDDPIVGAVTSGATLKWKFGGQSISVNSKNSKSAAALLKKHCS